MAKKEDFILSFTMCTFLLCGKSIWSDFNRKLRALCAFFEASVVKF